MKLSQSLNDALNAQILIELGNQLKYMAISNYFENLQLKNLAKYFHAQADEEFGHAKEFTEHVNKRVGGKVTLGEVETPNILLDSIISIGNQYLALEEDTTVSIEELYDLALEEKSFIDLGFLTHMLDTQIIEEDEALELSTKLNMVKDFVLFDATME